MNSNEYNVIENHYNNYICIIEQSLELTLLCVYIQYKYTKKLSIQYSIL